MDTYRIFYLPQDSKKEACALIPADSVKQALTRFNAAGFDGRIDCIQNVKFDSSLFNF